MQESAFRRVQTDSAYKALNAEKGEIGILNC